MARYEITFADGYGREIDRMAVTAASMAQALTVSGDLLLNAVRDGEHAVSASVEELGVYACEVDESAGQEELHSIRHELHPVGGVDLDAVARLEAFAREADPSTGTED
jgi:hypothetical protein